MRVHAVTATFSIFAYVWLIIILMVSTPDVIDVWEERSRSTIVVGGLETRDSRVCRTVCRMVCATRTRHSVHAHRSQA